LNTYTHGHQDAVLRSHRWRTAANSAAYLLPYLRPGLDLLDAGCGPGTLTIDLARRLRPGRVVGIDVANEVITEATASITEAGVDNVSFLSGDFLTADLPAGGFDVVHAHQVLQHVSDPVGALVALRRYVRPGGLVAARDSDYSAMTWHPSSVRLDRWLAIYLAVTRHNQAEANAGRYLLAWAHRAGLADVAFTSSTWTFADPAARSWWGELWAERTVGSSFADQAVAYGIASADELASIANGWREWAGQPDAVFVVPHGEIVARV
jgi:2-polyprenyl-3-methyl-5-hydroxy-6-metoxy-1,4-benzoquinol methylase